MLEFKKVTFDDYELINTYYTAYPARQCDRSTAATVMWRNYYDNRYAVYDGTIIFSSNFTGDICFTHPVGRNVDGMLEKLEEYCKATDTPMTVCSVNKEELPFILEKYPDCDFVSWDRPVKDKCPQCGDRMVFKAGPKETFFHVCVNETCRHRVQVELGGNDE